jgi:hypothetical protein
MLLSPRIPASAGSSAPGVGGLPPWLGRTRDWRWLLLYLGVPSLIGLMSGMNNWAILEIAGYEQTLVFYAGHSFLPWWVSGIATYALYRLLAFWELPPVVLLVLGGTVACFVILPYVNWVTTVLSVGWLPGDVDGSRSASHIMRHVGFWPLVARAVVSWTLINLAFDRWLGLPRFRYTTPVSAPDSGEPDDTTAVAPADEGADSNGAAVAVVAPIAGQRLLQRLPAEVPLSAVIAIKAEQHYVKVYTAERSFMTLYRFSDAIAEMDPVAGAQLHRSWWVRLDAIQRLRRDGRRYAAILANGLEVPISSSNRGVIQNLARRAKIALPPA